MDELTQNEAESLLRWWTDSGVDGAVAEQPLRWLRSLEQPPNPPAKLAPSVKELPATLEGFRAWLERAPDLPFASAGGRRVLPHGPVNPSAMLVCDAPGSEDVSDGTPLGGPGWLLAERIMRAIGIASDQVYSSSLSSFHLPLARLDGADLEQAVALFRHHLALVAPRRLLLLGDGPCRALLGQPLASARGKLHSFEGVATVVTFHPRFLIQRPGNKAWAWQDLLLFPQEDVE